MEFHSLASTALRGLNVFETTKLRESFLNVNSEEQFVIYCFILIVKCFTASYGMRQVPGSITFTMLLLNSIKTSVCVTGFFRIIRSVLHFLIATLTLFLFNDEVFHPVSNAIVLMVACLYDPFEFFLDSFLVVLFIFYVFRVYGKEIDKSITLISYLFCLAWFTDYVLGVRNLGMIHAALVVHAPVFLLSAFIPSNPESQHNFMYLAIGIAAWQVYRLSKAVVIKGVTDNPFFILDETLDAINLPIKWLVVMTLPEDS